MGREEIIEGKECDGMIENEVKKELKVEADNNIKKQKVLYLCNGEKPDCRQRGCYKKGSDQRCECRYTSDIQYAKNFQEANLREDSLFIEREGVKREIRHPEVVKIMTDNETFYEISNITLESSQIEKIADGCIRYIVSHLPDEGQTYDIVLFILDKAGERVGRAKIKEEQ